METRLHANQPTATAFLMLLPLLMAASCGGASDTVTPTAPTSRSGLACGEERWSVKTLSDPDALRVNLAPAAPTTIAALNALPAHCSAVADVRTFAEEFQTYALTGRVTFVAQEDDRDYHLALADPDAPDQTMIVESPDPQCEGAATSPYVQKLRDARQMLLTISGGRPGTLVGQTVRVQGVGFYDADHGQRGRSRSCIELHPILRIE